MPRLPRSVLAFSRVYLSESSAKPLHLRLIVSDTCSLCARFANSLDQYAKTIVDTRPISYVKLNIKDLPEELREKHQYDIPVLLDDSDNLLLKHRFSRSAFEERMVELVVVLHGGVTFRDSRSAVDACKVAATCAEAVDAVQHLEASGAFNAGSGSSLTREGTLEMEAAVCRVDASGEMDFGAIGACSRLVSPVRVADAVAGSRKEQQNDGLIDPMVLVGAGAERWASNNDMPVVDIPAISPQSQKEWRRAMELVNDTNAIAHLDSMRVMDTVGAVDMDLADWSSTAACSSGGVILKRPGRLGHCTVFGAGAWVERREWKEACFHRRRSVSICLSGSGEAIVRVDGARTIARRIVQRPDSTTVPEVVAAFYREQFHAGNPLLGRMDPTQLYLGGVAIVREEKTREEGGGSEDDDDEDDYLEAVVFHNTPFLPVAWRDAKGRVRGMTSKREEGGGDVVVTVLPL